MSSRTPPSDPFLDDEIRRRNTKSDKQILGPHYHESTVISLLTEIRDTLQGRRGMIALPSAEEVKRYGS